MFVKQTNMAAEMSLLKLLFHAFNFLIHTIMGRILTNFFLGDAGKGRGGGKIHVMKI